MIDYAIVIIVLALMLFIIVRGIKRAKKGETSCSSGCGGCSSAGNCHKVE
jgi:hypothetical protein